MNKFESFLTEKGINKEQFTAKSAEEMAGLYNEYNEKNATVLAELVEKGKEDMASEIKALKEDISQNRVEQMKALNESLKHRDLMIKKLSEQEKVDGVGVVNSVRKGLDLNKENLVKMKGNKNVSISE